MSKQWSGVFSAVTTKFLDNGKLDVASMERHFDFQIESGVHGIIVLGSLGENVTLSPIEKQEVLKTALRVSGGRVPVLSGVAETSTALACNFIEQGQANGANGFMVMPAMVYPADQREAITYFKTVAAASSVPIMLYNNPVSYKVDLTPQVFAELADEPKFVALKESSDNVRRVTDIINAVGNRYQIFTGVDDIAMESLMLGAVGWVAGLVCAFPRETVVVYKLAKAGRIEEALKIYRWFMPLLHLDVSAKFVQNIKLAEALAGVGTEHVRPPRLPLIGEERMRVEQVVKRALETRPELPAV